MSAKLKLPMYMSEPAKTLIKGLLRRTLKIRLGSGPNGAADIKKHPFFRNVDWDAMSRQEVTPPYIPDNEGELDVSRFDERYCFLFLAANLPSCFVFTLSLPRNL